MLNKKARKSVGIIGSGIIGLTVASLIQEKYPDVLVRVHTSGVYDSTTSWGAVGLFKLGKKGEFVENRLEDVQRWFRTSLEHYMAMSTTDRAVEYGCFIVPFYELYDTEKHRQENEFKDLYLGYRLVNSRELSTLGLNKRGMTCGFSFNTVILESRYCLPHLTNQITSRGGEFKLEKVGENINESDSIIDREKKISDWAEQYEYDLIVNCSGLGSRHLFGDSTIYPVRGQLVRISAPWIKHSFITNEATDTYIYSCKSSVVIGGFREPNNLSDQVDPDQTLDLLDRATQFYPHLKNNVTILEEWVGFRPVRPSIRIETQNIISSSGKSIPVIHNYGHGARGVALSWGTSLDAVELCKDILKPL